MPRTGIKGANETDLLFETGFAINVLNPATGLYQGFGQVKSASDITIVPAEVQTIKSTESRSGPSQGQTRARKDLANAGPTLRIATSQLIDRTGADSELDLIAAAHAGTAGLKTQTATTAQGFSIAVSALDRSYPIELSSGEFLTALTAASAIAHRQIDAPTTGTATGSATAADASSLTDSAQTWTVDDLIGKAVMILSGTGKGQVEAITANTATSVTVAAWSGTTPAVGDTYAIVDATALGRYGDAALGGAAPDYKVDTDADMIRPLSGGAAGLVAGDVIHGYIDAAGWSASRILGSTKTSIDFQLVGRRGIDRNSENPMRLQVFHCKGNMTAEQKLANGGTGDAFAEITIEGEMLTPEGYEAPYILDLDIVSA